MRKLRMAAIFCLIAWAGVAAGQGTCSTEMLQGTYAVEHSGLVYMGLAAPYSLLGTIAADAAGNIESRWVQVNPFGAPQYTQSGYWTVTPDCKVTLTHVQNGNPAGVSVGLVLHNGEEIRLMLTSPLMRVVPPPPATGGQPYPSVGSGILRRMTPGANHIGNCSAKMLQGTYAQTCTGYIKLAGPPMTFLPLRATITVASEGDGTGEGSGKLVYGGAIHAFQYVNLSYTVDPDCWASATFEVEGETGTWREKMIVFDEGKEMISTTLSSPTGQIDICRFTRMQR